MNRKNFKATLVVCFVFFNILSTKCYSQKEYIPIYFPDYYLTINEIPKLRDTLYRNLSDQEYFKFVFYTTKGKCYCEKYVNGRLYEKGHFENSIDTLKRYISARSPIGRNVPIKIQKYFQPLKNGEWIIYKNKKILRKEVYSMGILINRGN